MDFGAFVELEPGIEGLVHISELSHKRVWRAADVVKEGDEIEVLVLNVNPQAQRMSLSIRALHQPEPTKKEKEEAQEAELPAATKKSNRPSNAPLKGGLGRDGRGTVRVKVVRESLMRAILEKKFTKTWETLKKSPGVGTLPWFKKADAAVPKKLDAYQKAQEKAQSGLIGDLLKLRKALQQLEEAAVKLLGLQGPCELIADDPSRSTAVAEIKRYKAKVQHERATFESRLKSALAAADQDIKKLESLDPQRRKNCGRGLGWSYIESISVRLAQFYCEFKHL